MPVQISFNQIKPHGGSQHRAFEELCFQLIPVLETLPKGIQILRHGTPDGGVEAIGTLPDGSVWAWQAKFFFTLGASEFSQMDRSVKEALDSQPNLKRYVFCIPYNRPAAHVPGRRSAMERWQEHCQKWQAWAKDKGMAVEFGYIGESELLAALTLPGQSGRAYYWFNATVFTPEWFADHMAQAIETAGPRYTSELNVELPIATVFEGLGRTTTFQTRLRASVRVVRDAQKWYSLRDLAPWQPDLVDELRDCQGKIDSLEAKVLALEISSEAPIDFPGIAAECSEIAERLWEFSRRLHEQAWNLETPQRESRAGLETAEQKQRVALESAAYQLSRTARSLQDLKELIESDAALAVNVPALFIAGEAGRGKTHLLCDVAQSRINTGQPTVVLFGERFGTGEPWGQILSQLYIDCSVDEFLGALNAAAEIQNSRALIFLDALNEGQGPDLWPNYLAQFLEKARLWPRIGIALSCRASYVNVVVPENLGDQKLVRVHHEGFSGREEVAVRAFFDRYKLQLPDFPVLVPEFRNPLFLKIMCKGLSEAGFNSLPRGSSGITGLFNLFLDSVDGLLWRPERCDYAQNQRLVHQAVERVAQEMVNTDQDWVDFGVGSSLIENLLPGRPWSKSLLNGLLSEGVLTRDKIYREDGQKDALLFSYQRFGDHLRAMTLCDRNVSLDSLKALCRDIASDSMTSYRNSGLLQALSVLLPERFGMEFHELAPDPSLEPVEDAYLESLVWRNVEAFPENLTLNYLDDIARSSIWGNDRALETILQIACVPDHPLNADRLHTVLWKLSIAARDSWWSIFLHDHSGEDSHIERMIEWAWTGDTQPCADDAALLCATTLAWYLTSSRRFLRDRATKALVSLLHRRLHLVPDLLIKFHGINDPYVAGRLYAVAYGCCLISSDKNGIKSIAKRVYELIFSDGQPPVHILLRDYARGTLERATNLGCLPQVVDWTKVLPPYQSPWPITAPSEQSLRKRYWDGLDGYNSLWLSMMGGIADFRNYIVDTTVRRFVASNQRARQADSRRATKRSARESWETFIATLDGEQLKSLADIDKDAERLARFHDSLTEEQSTNLSRALRDKTHAREPQRLIPFDSGLACRWIFCRVLNLGWTPQRFGEFDRRVSYFSGRSEHKVERIGKKYQWIGFHELVARVSDHCQVFEGWSDGTPHQYDGPWEISPTLRDVDPSLLLRSTKRILLDSFQPCWWAPVTAKLSEEATTEAREQWLRDDTNLPTPPSFVDVLDGTGRRWISLEGYYTWEEFVPPELDRFETERCRMWYQIRSYLIHKKHLPTFKSWAKYRNWMGLWMPQSHSISGVFLGEYPWHASSREWEREWEAPRERSVPAPVMVTSASYTRGGNEFDCSVDDTVSGLVPSSYLIRGLGISWSGEGFQYVNKKGELIAWDPTTLESGPPALLIDPQELSDFLEEEELTLVWTVLGEKRISTPSWDQRAYKGHLEIYGLLNLEGGAVHQVSLNCDFKEPQK